jgi:hypothetical protein
MVLIDKYELKQVNFTKALPEINQPDTLWVYIEKSTIDADTNEILYLFPIVKKYEKTDDISSEDPMVQEVFRAVFK